MIVDTSVLVEIALRQPGYEILARKIQRAESRGISTASLLETSIVLGNRLPATVENATQILIEQLSLVPIPFTEAHWRIATDAFLRFGKGRHPAALNFGDCMTYATAKLAGEPLLFVGNDFAATDLPRA